VKQTILFQQEQLPVPEQQLETASALHHLAATLTKKNKSILIPDS
jgi:hypothetical protein